MKYPIVLLLTVLLLSVGMVSAEDLQTGKGMQTGKMMPRPIIMVESKKSGYWRSWLRFVMRSLLSQKMIDPADVDLFQIVKSPEDARNLIVSFYKIYHSMRFVGNHLVIRIKNKLDAKQLEHINRNFQDILVRGKIEVSGPLASEFNEPEIAHLNRLVFHFDRKNYGRLKQLVDEINKIG